MEKLSDVLLAALSDAGFVNFTNIPVWKKKILGGETWDEIHNFTIKAHAVDLGKIAFSNSLFYVIITQDGQVWLSDFKSASENDYRLSVLEPLAQKLELKWKFLQQTRLPTRFDVIEHGHILLRARYPYYYKDPRYDPNPEPEILGAEVAQPMD